MPPREVSDEDAIKRYTAWKEHGAYSYAGKALGIDDKAVKRGVDIVHAKGLHLSSGARLAISRAGLSGTEGKGGWIHNYDEEGKKVGATRWSAPEIDVEGQLDRIRAAFEDIPAAVPVSAPEYIMQDMLALHAHADVHVGMRVTADQTGGRSYGRAEAEARFKAAVSQSILSVPPCHTALILNAGDMMHANDDRDVTPRSGYHLKVEGSHHENFDLCVMLTIYKIDLALQRHGQVIYRAIPGNHDPNTPGPLSIAIRERYRNEPRAEIIVSEDEFWQRNWGEVFLSGHHGHGRKPKDVCHELPGKFPEAWGKAKQWHYFTAHLHNYQSVPIGSVRHHQFPSVCSADTHAAWSPYGDQAGMVSLTFHKKTGLDSLILKGV